MKRKIRFSIVLCLLTLLVTGCKSSDYKEAQSLYIKGEYAAAKPMFEKLADYEDSQSMVVECDYQLALKQIEDSNYREALDTFTALGDYKDCRTKVRLCSYKLAKELLAEGALDEAEAYLNQAGDYEDARQILSNLPAARLMSYLDSHGELSAATKVSQDSTYVVTLRKLTEDTIEITYDFTGRNSTVTNDTRTTMVLTLGDTKLQVQGTYNNKINVFGKISKSEEAVEGELDIRTYRYGDEMLWDKTFFKGNDINGNPLDPKVSGFYQVASNAPLERAFQSVEAMLAEHNVGVTLKQLGFASLE